MEKQQTIQTRIDRLETEERSCKLDEHEHPEYYQRGFDDEGYWNLSD